MENEEASIYELSKAWAKIEEGLVQSINLDPEVGVSESNDDEDPGFDYIMANDKLNRIFRNVGKSAQSAEFGGNDVWLILGKYPIRNPGESATFLYAGDDTYKNRDGFYDIFKRTVNQSSEYEDETLDSGDYEPMLAKAINMRPTNIKEVDSPEDAIERRHRDEKPSGPIIKTIKLDGPIADLLDLEMQKGDMEWTDGFQGNGPFLPKAVEDYILKIAGNDTEEPFIVRFKKYCSKNPIEPRGAAIEVEYEQESMPENQFRR
jgi:hypothetical protein